MDKRKNWRRYLIIVVGALTLYNILPTVFYYSRPLRAPIDAARADTIAQSIVERVNDLEPQAEEWLKSFCSLLHLKPLSIQAAPQNPQIVELTFKQPEEAAFFRAYLPRAGALISFVPNQLTLYDAPDTNSSTVRVQRQIPIHFDTAKTAQYTAYSSKFDEKGEPTPLYRGLIQDRALQVGLALGGSNEYAEMIPALADSLETPEAQDRLSYLAGQIVALSSAYGENSPVSARYFTSFSQGTTDRKMELATTLLRSMEKLQNLLAQERLALHSEKKDLETRGVTLEVIKEQRLHQITSHEATLASAIPIVRKNNALFAAGKNPWDAASLGELITKDSPEIPLQGRNPFIEKLIIDWEKETLSLILYPDVLSSALQEDKADSFLYQVIAQASRLSGEAILPFQKNFRIQLSTLNDAKSFLALRLSCVAESLVKHLQQTLTTSWQPHHPDLIPANFPIYDGDTYLSLPKEKQKLCLVIYAPAIHKNSPLPSFRPHSIYLIARGMDSILARAKLENSRSDQFLQDFRRLQTLLQQNHFFGYSGKTLSGKIFAHDFIFEAEDYFQMVLKATREDFSVHGTKRYAVLEFSNLEQRLLTENRIADRIHEDLLGWRDAYVAAQIGSKNSSKYDTPKPTQNAYWSNWKLSFVKYFRGDERKILHWGLDLSGGKTVQIQLRDASNRPVTKETDLSQGINELYNRVNKMGVSEVSIRQEGNYITLDFPGSQGWSGADLVKASSMYFHVVNEKFSPSSPSLAQPVQEFLEDVWNEAVVTNRKLADEIHTIACRHLYGDSLDPALAEPRSEAARILLLSGLRLAPPMQTPATSTFDETFSSIALLRGDHFSSWQGQSHPLLFVFHHYALEGSNLQNVQSSYDPSKGNFLNFSVRNSYTSKEGEKITPREDLYAWTSQFAKETIGTTGAGQYSNGRGWRMAVILNGSIISSPTLDSPLKDGASITGKFSQREVSQLEADFKAGSLSYTPYIVSEKNVSPELGSQERTYGIIATLLSFVLVITVLISYYRFAGTIASLAVLFTLFLMWATLQNLQATMTLAGIAGIILTLGMAVDANVLVFERIREEFAQSGRIASAVHAGYRKAYSAIIDSNVTTIIAAIILLNFDSGPIKGFAVTLLIGIFASLFSSLFATKYFFAKWTENPSHQSLRMCSFFRARSFDFLKHTKLTVICSACVILVGAYMFLQEGNTLFGMDFKGGYALNIEIDASAHADYRKAVEAALIRQGASSQELQVRELSPSNHLRIFLSRSLQEPGHPFFAMPLENTTEGVGFPYETNPRITWVVQALHNAGLSLNPTSLQQLDKTWTAVSGQMSATMRNHALIGLLAALLSILIYITVRFEFAYAISATICLAHDLLFTAGAIAILHACKIPIQIDLNIVTALLTMIGYSLNDTIIVFDRIREDVRFMKNSSFTQVINHALNVTLSRTLLTSGSTLLILVPLIVLGGSTLFGFALVMAIGVIFGTLSSLFIAAPLMKYFHDREKASLFPTKNLPQEMP